jgi:hypothetical protein
MCRVSVCELTATIKIRAEGIEVIGSIIAYFEGDVSTRKFGKRISLLLICLLK